MTRPLVFFSICSAIASAGTLKLKPETVDAWNDYLQTAALKIQERETSGHPFLWVDEDPERAKRIEKQAIVAPVGPHIPKKVPSGLIHHWIGAAFMPNMTIHDAMLVIRDYTRYKDFYHPNVIESRTIDVEETQDRFSTVLMNKAFFKKTALNSEYLATYTKVDEHRMCAVSQSTHIQEIAEYGAPGQHMLPDDEGTGLIWRLYTALRFEERNGGLIIEVEAIALSRDIPASIRVVAEPIVRRVSRDSLLTALKQTETAVRSAASTAMVRESHR